jgi:flavodoxin
MRTLQALFFMSLVAAIGCGQGGSYDQSKEPVCAKGENNKNKTLIVYYSRTGNTKTVAETLRETFDADLQEIRDLKDRAGISGFIGGMIDVKTNARTTIEPESIDMKNYDLIIICSPTWGMRFAPSITTFMESADFNNKNVLFVAVAAMEMKEKTFVRLGTTIASKGGKAVGHMLVKTFLKNPKAIQEETKKLTDEVPALKTLQRVN